MNEERWKWLGDYAVDLFGGDDPQLQTLMGRAVEAGLPNIAVSADVGRLLKILTALTDGELAIELGTLGGYSGIWLARGLAPAGRLITVEYEDLHADFAAAEFAAAGVADRVEIVKGAALDVIPALLERFGERSVDLVFIDAVKHEYVAYFETIKPMIKSNGLIVADNVYGTGQGWLDEGFGTDDFNRALAEDPEFEAVTIPIRQGVLIARRVS